GVLVFGGLSKRRALAVRPGVGFAVAALVGSSGLFFLPRLGALAHGFPAWDMAVFGVGGHGNPLFYSALAPIGFATLLYSVARLRGLLAGFAVGVAAHLLVVFAANLVDIRDLPNMLYLDQIWLPLNAMARLALAYIGAKR